jgi:hypothetical protein
MTSNYTPPRSWNTVIGRPYVTVSASTTYDGSDYGAFTPGTTTSGIQEALTALEGTGGKVFIKPGIYQVNSAMTYTSFFPVEICGIWANDSENGTTLTGAWGTFIQPGSSFPTDSYLLTVNGASSSNGGRLYLHDVEFLGWKVDAGGTIPDGGNASVYGVSFGNNIVACRLENIKFEGLGLALNAESGGGPMFFDHLHFANCGGTSSSPTNETVNLSMNSAFFSNCEFYAGYVTQHILQQNGTSLTMENCHFYGNLSGTATASDAMTLYSSDQVAISNCYFDNYKSYVIVIGGTPSVLSVVNCRVGGKTGSQSPFILFNSSPSTPITVSLANIHLTDYNTLLEVSSGLTFPAGSTLTGKGIHIIGSDSGIGLTSYPSNFVMNIELATPLGFGITSPSVPASGTAQVNTFPFPVRVYLLTGGTGTAFTLTDPAGNAKSVTATLLAGMEWTLDPGASITLTYSTAPTWAWYGI